MVDCQKVVLSVLCPISMPEAFLYQFASVRTTTTSTHQAEFIRQNMLSMGFKLDVVFVGCFQPLLLE